MNLPQQKRPQVSIEKRTFSFSSAAGSSNFNSSPSALFGSQALSRSFFSSCAKPEGFQYADDGGSDLQYNYRNFLIAGCRHEISSKIKSLHESSSVFKNTFRLNSKFFLKQRALLLEISSMKFWDRIAGTGTGQDYSKIKILYDNLV